MYNCGTLTYDNLSGHKLIKFKFQKERFYFWLHNSPIDPQSTILLLDSFNVVVERFLSPLIICTLKAFPHSFNL